MTTTQNIVNELEIILDKIKSGEYIASSLICTESKMPIKSKHEWQPISIKMELIKKVK